MTDQLHRHTQEVNSIAEHVEQNEAHLSTINTMFTYITR